MFPVLFRIPLPWGDADTYFPVRMFGVLVILGFLAGWWVVSRRLAKRNLMQRQESFDFCFYLLAVGIAGARIMHVVQEFEQFRGKFFRVFAIWEGGLVWYGGFAAAALFAFWWLGKRKMPVLEITDACVLGLALALCVGRWGCFCAGDDFGLKFLAEDGSAIVAGEHAPWYAVQFPGVDAGWRYQFSETPLAPESFRAPFWLHPVQIYMSIANLFVFLALVVVSRLKLAASKPGIITAAYLMIYPVGRAVTELWRGDIDRGVDVMGTGLSFSQAFGIPVILFGAMLLRYIVRPPPPPEQKPA